MSVDVTSLFTAHLARNLGPTTNDPTARETPEYGVSARLNGSVVELALTFRGGAAYCCYEWGCHLGLTEGQRWEWLRRELAAAGLAPPGPLALRLSVVVEAGALFFDYAQPIPEQRGRYWLSPSQAVQYQATTAEPSHPDDELRDTAEDDGG